MLSHDGASSPANLDRVLKRSRRAWWSSAVGYVAASALAVAAATMLVMWFAAWLASRAGPLVLSGNLLESSVGRLVLASFILALGTGVLVAAWRSPSRLELAREVDRRAGLPQLLSTAWEVISRGGPSTVVTRALITEAEARSADVGARRLGPRSHPWLPRTVAPALLVIVATVLIPVPERQVLLNVSPGLEAGPTLPGEAEVETLRAAARLFELVAEREDSPYLRAVATSFHELSVGLEAGTVTAAEAGRAMQELSQHLQAAAQDIGGAFGDAITDAMTASRAGSESMAPFDLADQATAGETPLGAPDQPSSVPGAFTGSSTDSSASSPFDMLDTLVDQFENDPTSLGLPPPRAAAGQGSDLADFYGGVLRAERDPNAALVERPAGPRAAGQGGGDVAGAAQQSSDSAGDAAGQGAADLGVGSDAFLSLDIETSVAAALPRNELEEGRFTEMELLPSESTDLTVTPYDLSSLPSFQRADEAAFLEHGIASVHRDVVSRYFTPSSSSVER